MENPTVVYPGVQEVELRDVGRPDPDEGELLIETTRSLISTGTELTVYSGEFPEGSWWDGWAEYPFETGYSNVGVVIEVGEGVESDWIGETVATRNPHGKYVTADVDGLVARVPEAVPEEEAAFFAIGGIVMNGVRRGEVEWGEDAGIYGVGLLGQLTARLCDLAGARNVIAFDLAEPRLDLLPDARSVTAANPAETDAREVVEDATGGRLADVVFEVTGNPDVITDELDVLRNRGRFVVLSSPRGKTEIDLHDHCNNPSYEIVGAHEMSHPPRRTGGWGYEAGAWTHDRHYELFFELIEDRRLDVGGLISHRVPHREAPSIFEKLHEDRSDAMGVVIEWD